MHAPPRHLVQRAAWSLAIATSVILAGCSGRLDNPALPEPSTANPPSPVSGQTGPSVSLIVVSGAELPELAGNAGANATIRRAASGLPAGCTPRTEVDTPRLASFLWGCPGGRRVAATVSLPEGHLLALGDLLTVPGRSYLSSVAAAQFQAAGVRNAPTSDLSIWYLTPETLDVVFPTGVISFPLASLSPYIARSSGYGTLLQGT